MNFLETLFGVVLANSVRVALLVIAFLAVRRILRKCVPAASLYAVWIVVAAKLLFPGGWSTAWSPYNLIPAATPLNPTPPAVTSSSGQFSIVADEPGAPSAQPPISWTRAAALTWLAVVGALLARRMAASALLRRNVIRGEVATDGRVRQMVDTCSIGEGFARPIHVRTTEAVTTPALFGLFRPTLLLPPALSAQLTNDELRLVIRHELAHCHRRDLLSKTLIEVAAIAHWFNPAVRLALPAARLDCELACDERVLRGAPPETRASYGATLLKVLQLDPEAPRVSPALGILEDREQFKQRIQMIISNRRIGAARLASGAALLTAVAVLAVTRESHLQAAETPPVAPRQPVQADPAGTWAPGQTFFQSLPAAPGKPGAISIGVRDDGNVIWNGEQVPFQGFVDRLGALDPSSNSPVQIYAAPSVRIEYVLHVLDAIRKAGVGKVGFSTVDGRLVSEEARQAAQAAEKSALAARADADEIAKRLAELRQDLAVKQVDQKRAEQAMRQVQDQMAKLKADAASLQIQGNLDQARVRLAEQQVMSEQMNKMQGDQTNADRAYAAARVVEQARIEMEQQRAEMERQMSVIKAQLAQPPVPAP